MPRGPLADRYAAVAAMVMFALIPYLALSAALDPLTPIIARQLHTSLQAMSLSSGLGNAAYAVGTVLAVQFAQHLPQRRMMVIYTVFLVIGSVLLALGGGTIGAGIYAFSGARAQAPDLGLFLAQTGPAWYSPPLLAKLRSNTHAATLIPESAD
jgi:MFS family permease